MEPWEQEDFSRDGACFQQRFSNHPPQILHPRKRCGHEPLIQLLVGFGGICKGFFGGGSREGVLGLPPGWTVLARTGWESEVLIFQDLGEFSWRSISNPPSFIHSSIHKSALM